MQKQPLVNKNQWLIFQDDKLLLLKNNNELLKDEQLLKKMIPSFIRSFPIEGLNDTKNTESYFCAEINKTCELPPELELVPLRSALISHFQFYHPIVKAYSILRWDRNHLYCGQCGEKTTHKLSLERFCSSCQISFFPRISPSIITLIHKNDEILMARGPHFPPGIFGLIAGFVDVGESIEDAVHREVKEEVGLRVKNLQYFGSQPWPFPDSLMIAFTAEYDAGEIVINPSEIEQANWYHFNNLPSRPALSISIASQLIDHFLNEKQKTKSIVK